MTRAMPSREFFVTQAVLNAAAEEFPHTQAVGGTTAAIQKLVGQLKQYPHNGEKFLLEQVTREHRKLVAQYIEPRAVIATAYADALKSRHGAT